jgi:hypothetical protein
MEVCLCQRLKDREFFTICVTSMLQRTLVQGDSLTGSLLETELHFIQCDFGSHNEDCLRLDLCLEVQNSRAISLCSKPDCIIFRWNTWLECESCAFVNVNCGVLMLTGWASAVGLDISYWGLLRLAGKTSYLARSPVGGIQVGWLSGVLN